MGGGGGGGGGDTGRASPIQKAMTGRSIGSARFLCSVWCEREKGPLCRGPSRYGMEKKTLAETVKANNPKLAVPNFFIPNFSRSAFLENAFDFLGQQGVHVIAEAILTALLDLIPIILDLFDGIGQDDE
jgi:hypothetical protein